MLYEILRQKTKDYFDSVALQDKKVGAKTYGQFWNELEETRAKLVNHSKRIALIGENSYGWVLLCYAMYSSGKTVIVIDALLPKEDISQILKDTEADEAIMLLNDEELEISIKDNLSIPVYKGDALLEQSTEQNADVSCKDGELVVLTSGTSSKSKAVDIPVQCLVKNGLGLENFLALNREECMYIPIPLSHLYGQNVLMTCLLAGRKSYMGKAKRFMSELKTYAPKGVALVPSMAEFVVEHLDEIPELKMIVVAGSKCEKHIQDRLMKRGIYLQNQYGMSEFGGALGCSKADGSIDDLFPIPGVIVTTSSDGELVSSYEGVHPSYYKGNGVHEDAWFDSGLLTGDLGQIAEDGSFSIIGRKKDIIPMKNGNKLYCLEIDEQLALLPGVSEACVIYVNDKIISVLVAVSNEDTIAAYDKYCAEQPYYRRPNDVWFRQKPLPRTGIGKLIRRQVEFEYLERSE